MQTIKVSRSSLGYYAWLDGVEPRMSGEGKTIDEAIGSLVHGWLDKFRMRVIEEVGRSQKSLGS